VNVPYFPSPESAPSVNTNANTNDSH
jgi:hypothetical protein